MRMKSVVILVLLVCLANCTTTEQDILIYRPIPRYPNIDSPSKDKYSIEFTTHDTVEDVTRWYSETLTTQGWEYIPVPTFNKESQYDFLKAFDIEEIPGDGKYIQTLIQMRRENSLVYVKITQVEHLRSSPH